MSKDFLEHKAFVELFDLHYGNLVGFVYGYVRDEEVAKDIVHDTFLTFWNNRKRLDLSYSAKSYLFTLAQNYALNYLRHLRVVEVNEREVSQPSTMSVMLVWKRNWLSCRINNGRFS